MEASAESQRATLGQQLADLEQLVDVGFWDYDIPSATLAWSTGQCRLYGVDPESFGATYEAWLALVHPDDRPMVERTIAAAVERVGDYGFDHRFHRVSDGALRWTRCRGRVLAGADGRAARVFGVSVDTTAEHRAAAARAEFVANAAHELRTPAAAISQAVQALSIAGDEDRAEIVAALQRQAARLRRLTTNLVDLAAIETAPSAALREAVPLAEAVAGALGHAPPPPGVEVVVDVPPGAEVRADAQDLDRILVNLLTNAWRYGGPHVVLRVVPGEAGQVDLEVADDGPGVPPGVRQAMFEPFRRGPQRHPEASGLGLAIVDRLVRRLGGRVAHRDADPGSVFTVSLERA